MNKAIEFSYKGKDYTLEFTRKSVETMDRQGFVASHIVDHPMTVLPTLFRGAFVANHRNVKPEIIDEIFSKLTNKQDLIGKLGELYNAPIMALMDEPDEDEGNVQWGANF